jgi:hypothetical protein
MTRVLRWVTHRQPCLVRHCRRVEYRAGWCRTHWAVERARLVWGRVTR